jgi:hypothetical protein
MEEWKTLEYYINGQMIKEKRKQGGKHILACVWQARFVRN